nr:hypothetical protein [Streptomyces sp. CBMA291]
MRPFGGVLTYTPAQRAALHAAEENLVSVCMRRRGFDYDPEGLATGGTDPDDRSPYGLLTTSQALQDGYGITSAALLTHRPKDPNRVRSRQKGWQEALLGTPAHKVTVSLPGGQKYFYNSDSCVSSARGHLYGSGYERLYNLFQVLANDVISTVRTDADYQRVQGRWAACMAGAGERVAVLDDPRDQVDRRLRTALQAHQDLRPVAEFELELSRRDARCQRTVRLDAAVKGAQQRAERTKDGTYHDDLSRLRAMRAEALRRSQKPSSSSATIARPSDTPAVPSSAAPSDQPRSPLRTFSAPLV